MLLVFLSILPILCLMTCLLVFKMSAVKSGALGFCITAAIYYFYFQSGIIGLSISMSKGISLASFVVLIIWSAIFLYHLVKEVGALHVINRNIEIVVRDKFIQFLLLSWIFSSFLQGIAGFGVPVAVVTPILIGMGFHPVVSAAAVLVGHSWAISFGSMGSSIYAINMVTRAPVEEIVVSMALFGTVAMFLTGLSVAHIYDRKKGLLKGLPYVTVLTCVMGAVLSFTARFGMLSLMGLLTGLVGMIALFLVYRLLYRNQPLGSFYRTEINFGESILPYLLIVVLSLLFYFLKPSFTFSFDFPGYVTKLGCVVAAELDYVTFNWLKFPCTIILIASFISAIIYKKKGVFDEQKWKVIIQHTASKCVPTTLTITFLLCMAVLLMDSGMIGHIADGLVTGTKSFYPLFAPFIGLLGAFVTGSNTNSNIIFGSLQEMAANALGLSAVTMCAVQSIGASVGGGIGPTTVSLGAAAAHMQGEESLIYKKTLGPVLLIVLVLGIVNLIIV